MDDLEMDRLLTDVGEQFRATHHRVPTVTARRRSRAWLPAAAGLATAGLVTVLAVVLPHHDSTVPPVAGPEAYDTGMEYVDGTAFDDRYVVIAGGSLGKDDHRLEVHGRGQWSDVVFRATTHYPLGQPLCPYLYGSHVLWVDSEKVDTESVPGPPTRSSLWERDLATGRETELTEVRPVEPGDGFLPCPVGEGATVAWQTLSGGIQVRDLGTGSQHTVPHDAATGDLVGLSDGLLLLQSAHRLSTVDAASGRVGKVLVDDPLLTQSAAGHGKLLWITSRKGAETQDGVDVHVCSLPECDDRRLLAGDDGAARPVLGSGFAAWTSLKPQPGMVRFDGGQVPDLPGDDASFNSFATFSETFAYATGDRVLHLVPVR